MDTAPTSPEPELPPDRPGYGYQGPSPLARMPVPVPNSELILYVVVLVIIGIVILASDLDDRATAFIASLVVLTFAYFLSRGIAKRGRVDERPW